eukprot:comp18476_c0_seq1/m.19815 comp18476_c0_seq1/g.19815  ORF comp18476_c0_seq1/g.19815 comp18476_c0_seq1/m.19815 type:complete len:278 (-) comp18476_c0_seq1:501-1334(-)
MPPNKPDAPGKITPRPARVSALSGQKQKEAAWRNPWELDTADVFIGSLPCRHSVSVDEHRPLVTALPRHLDFLQHVFPGVSEAQATSFLQFMRLTVCLESLNFCLEVERFRSWCDDAGLDTIDDLADVSRQIYNRFIFANSPEEINLTHRTRAILAAHLLLDEPATTTQSLKTECPSVNHARKMLRLLEIKHMFDDAVAEALVHLKADLYPRFVASQADATLAPTLPTLSPIETFKQFFVSRWPTFARTKFTKSASAVELRRLSPTVLARENKKTAF